MKYLILLISLIKCINCFSQKDDNSLTFESDSICYQSVISNFAPIYKESKEQLEEKLSSANKSLNTIALFNILNPAFGEYTTSDILITFDKYSKNNGEKHIDGYIDSLYVNDPLRRITLKMDKKKENESYKLNELIIKSNSELPNQFADSISKIQRELILTNNFKKFIPDSLTKENSIKFIESLPKEKQEEAAMSIGYRLHILNEIVNGLEKIDLTIEPNNAGDELKVSNGEINYSTIYKFKSKDSKNIFVIFKYKMYKNELEFNSISLTN
jgi:hypothetical protein